MTKTFGQYIRELRLNKNFTLRQFSKLSGYDIGYISRLENEIITAPSEREKLVKLAKSYEVNEESEEYEILKNLADVSNRQIPEEIDSKILNYLPAFFRKASKKNVTSQDVEQLVKLIKGE